MRRQSITRNNILQFPTQQMVPLSQKQRKTRRKTSTIDNPPTDLSLIFNVDGRKLRVWVDTSKAVSSGEYAVIEFITGTRAGYGYAGRFYVINEKRAGLWLINDKLTRLRFGPQDVKLLGPIVRVDTLNGETVLTFTGPKRDMC